MKKYYVDKVVTYCYPYDIGRTTTDLGVLSEYADKHFNRTEMDRIICEMITRHPYIEGAMSVKISVCWREHNTRGYYHHLHFENDNCDKQKRGTTKIKYEK